MADRPRREESIAAELRRLEQARTRLVVDALRPMAADDVLLHLGWSEETVAVLAELGCRVVEGDAGRESGPVGAIVDSEIHRRRDLFAHCARLSQIIRPRGRYVFTTWCADDEAPPGDRHLRLLNERVGVVAQPRSRFLAALLSNGFVPYLCADLTRQAVPYWQLRLLSSRQTGVEQAFLSAYQTRSARLLLVAAERYDSMHPPVLAPVPVTVPASVRPQPVAPNRPGYGLAYD